MVNEAHRDPTGVGEEPRVSEVTSPADRSTTAGPEAKTLGVVGAGLMGSGIAQVASAAGLEVRLYDAAEGAVDRALDAIRDRLQRLESKDALAEGQADSARARISKAHSLKDLSGVDAIIEAVIEDLDVKQEIFEQLDQLAGDRTILATNTSALPITGIAGRCSRADQVIGMHFFSPVPRMALCELVRGYRTDDTTLTRAEALAATLGKQTILVNRDDAGFVTSRLMSVLVGEAARIVEQGLATAEDVDRACELGFGHRMGPLATTDLTGVDVAYRAARSIHDSTGDPSYRPPQILRRMVSAGALGRKTGEGFYRHGEVR